MTRRWIAPVVAIIGVGLVAFAYYQQQKENGSSSLSHSRGDNDDRSQDQRRTDAHTTYLRADALLKSSDGKQRSEGWSLMDRAARLGDPDAAEQIRQISAIGSRLAEEANQAMAHSTEDTDLIEVLSIEHQRPSPTSSSFSPVLTVRNNSSASRRFRVSWRATYHDITVQQGECFTVGELRAHSTTFVSCAPVVIGYPEAEVKLDAYVEMKEAGAMAGIRDLNTAELLYLATNPTEGFTCQISALLAARPEIADRIRKLRTEYALAVSHCGADRYQITAVPVDTGVGLRAFCANEDAVVRQMRNPKPKTPCSRWERVDP